MSTVPGCDVTPVQQHFKGSTSNLSLSLLSFLFLSFSLSFFQSVFLSIFLSLSSLSLSLSPLFLSSLFLSSLFLFILPSPLSSLLFPSRQRTLYKALINKHGVQL